MFKGTKVHSSTLAMSVKTAKVSIWLVSGLDPKRTLKDSVLYSDTVL